VKEIKELTDNKSQLKNPKKKFPSQKIKKSQQKTHPQDASSVWIVNEWRENVCELQWPYWGVLDEE